MEPTQGRPQRWYDAKRFKETHDLIREATQHRSRLVNLTLKVDSTDNKTLPTLCKSIKKCLGDVHHTWDKISDSFSVNLYVPPPPPLTLAAT